MTVRLDYADGRVAYRQVTGELPPTIRFVEPFQLCRLFQRTDDRVNGAVVYREVCDG